MSALAPWGKSVSIDLYECDHKLVASGPVIKKFIRQVIPLVKMKAHGPVIIDRFGNEELEGWSAMQFIETSSITVHADEVGNRCFVDIFSCKEFDCQKAVKFATTYFRAKSCKTCILSR
jgi:S-adenosylmethionine decarboxylase